MKSWQKTIAVVSTFALLLNSLSAPLTVFAQETTPEPTPEVTTTPEVTPTVEPTTQDPVITPAPTVEESAVPTPTDIATPTPEVTVEATPTGDLLTPAPETTPVVQETTNENAQSQGPPSDSNQPAVSESSASPSVTPIATPVTPKEEGTITTTVIDNIDLSTIAELNSNVDAPTVTTDKPDYSPTSVVLITGTGFTADKAYSLEISSTDEPPVTFGDSVSTDSQGTFNYAYQLDGNYRPNYKIDVKDGDFVIASTTFTDSVITYSVDTYGNTSHTTLKDSFYTGDTVYGKGTRSSAANIRLRYVNPSSAVAYTCSYSDSTTVYCDYSLPTNAPTGTWKIQLGRCDNDCSHDSNWVWTGYAEATFTVSNPTGSVSGYKWNDLNGDGVENPGEPKLAGWEIGYYKYDAPHNTWVGNTPDNILTDSNGNYTFSNLTPGDYYVTEFMQQGWELRYPTTAKHYFTITPGAAITGLKFGNHKTTADINITKLIDADGNPQTTGDQTPGNGWNFSVKVWAVGAPQTVVESTTTDSNGQGKISFVPDPTQYKVEETIKTGYIPVSSYCTKNGQPVGSSGSGSVFGLTAAAGDTINCTFINHNQSGHLTIVKHILPTSDSGRFNLSINSVEKKHSAGNGDSTGRLEYPTGRYTFSETAHSGTNMSNYSSRYDCLDVARSDESIASGMGTSQTIDLHDGDDIVCTFTNTKLGSISGYKWSDKDGDGHKDSDESRLSGWKIFIDGNGNGTYDAGETYDNTDSSGDYSFSNLVPGSYSICEVEKTSEGWHNTSGGVCQNVTVGAGQSVSGKNFGNRQLGSIKVCKVIVDPNGNITDGSVLSGDTFTINWDNHLDPTVFTAGTTPNEKIFSSSEGNDAYCITYDNLNVETYHYSQEVLSDSSAWATPKYNDQYSSHVYDLGDFYQYSSHNDNSNGEINLELVGPNRTLIVLNQYIARNPKLVLTKSNDKPSGVVPSENVTYTLSLQNTGDVDLGDIIVTDAPAGGFTYVNGSTLIDGVNTSDPSISGGQLSWTIPSLAVGGTVTIVYQLTTPSDLAAGTYTNFATCTTGRGQGDNITQFTTAPVIGRFSASCDPVTSTVAMGQSSNYGGNLNTTSRVLGISTVLGASTELPGTGSPTVLLLISLGALGAGLFLRIYDVKITKKSVKKVVKSAKKKGKKHAKK